MGNDDQLVLFLLQPDGYDDDTAGKDTQLNEFYLPSQSIIVNVDTTSCKHVKGEDANVVRWG